MPKQIRAGAFTIGPADEELAAEFTATLARIADGEVPVVVLDVRELLCTPLDDPEPDYPRLVAIALDAQPGPLWLVRGSEFPISLVPAKRAARGKKLLKPLVRWAETFTPNAACALAMEGYGYVDDDEVDDGWIHLTAELVLTGIDTHQEPDSSQEAWVNELETIAEATLEQIEVEGEIIVFDVSEEGRPALGVHAEIDLDDEAEAVAVLKRALTRAFAAFTPQAKVGKALIVEVEEDCLYDRMEEILAGMDLGDDPDSNPFLGLELNLDAGDDDEA